VDFRIEQRLAAPLPAVERAQLDPAFVAGLAALPRIGKAELIDQQEDGDVVDQEIHYAFAGELSGAVRAVVDPDKLSWILESRFDLKTHRADWRILPDHYAGKLSANGVTQLVEDGDATRRITDGVVKVHMPLVGGRVERAIVSGLKDHLDTEAAALARFLQERGG
jgi:hypothetical protein